MRSIMKSIYLTTGCEVMIVSHRSRLFLRNSMKSLVIPTMLAISLAGGRRGMRRYGNLISDQC